MTAQYRLWVGMPGRFADEVDALTSLLGTSVRDGGASVLLSPERHDSFDWIGDRQWSRRDGDFQDGGWLGLQTSGTTGAPAWVKKRFTHILNQRSGKGSSDERWLLCYSPARWAGISVIAHVMRHGAQLVVPRGLDPQSIAAAMASATHVSLTPSLFRKILISCGDGLGSIPLKQLTFGGEYASQRTLDDARTLWPDARITHVYACTEHGDLCAVSDGMEGMPAEKLRSHAFTADGELIIDGQATGDVWQQRGERLFFAGRREEMINVGGAKVSPSLVEAACMGIMPVIDCRAYAVKSALLGELVGLDYVGGMEPDEVRRHLLAALPKFAVPAKITRVDGIPVTSAGKKSRRP